MITVLTGDNSFEIDRATKQLIASFDGDVERRDAASVTLTQLADIFMGGSLFATKRLVILTHVSENKQLWDVLPDWIDRVADDVQVVLIDAKLDKRTKTYKTLQKLADIREYKAWGERDIKRAELWTIEEAQRQGLAIKPNEAAILVQRTGVHQWRLFHAVQKLAVMGATDKATIERIIEPNPTENVFQLFEALLGGDGKRVQQMIATLRLTEEPHMVLGLIASQTFQLAALAQSTDVSADAKVFGIHPFVAEKLARHARSMSPSQISSIVHAVADADRRSKTLAGDVWQYIAAIHNAAKQQ